jgi:hypothetical protein
MLSQLLVAELWLPYLIAWPKTLPQDPAPRQRDASALRHGELMGSRMPDAFLRRTRLTFWMLATAGTAAKRRRKRLRAAPNYGRPSTAWQGQEYLVNAAEPQACAILERGLMNIGLQNGARRHAPA